VVDFDEIKNKLREDRKRIITLEGDVGDLKIEMGKVSVALEHSDKRAEERHAGVKTSQSEIKTLIQERIEMDRERERDAREYRQQRETIEREASLARQRWAQSLLTPQTLIIVLAVILSLMGVKAGELLFAENVSGEAIGGGAEK
jgi:chromosome segregation ATPase